MPSRTGAGVVAVLRLLARPTARPAHAIYGTVLAAGLIASQDPQFDSTAEIAGTVLITVAVFWLAHGYGHAVGLHLADAKPRGRSVTGRRVAWAALVENWPMARASLLPVSVLAVARLAGAAVADAQQAAMWTCVALLAVWGFLAGRAAGLRTWRLAGYCAGSSLLGLALIVLEVLIH